MNFNKVRHPAARCWNIGMRQLGDVDHVRAALLAVVMLSTMSMSAAADMEADVLLQGGMVIDGTGSPSRLADVAILDGKIVIPEVGETVNAPWTIDCSNLMVCPGFIDLHNHSDGEVEHAQTRAAMNYVTQGCTTMVTGNCGSGPVAVGAYYDKIDEFGAGTNVAHLIPQGSLRKAVLKSDRVEPTEEQLQQMRQLAEDGMQQGAWGMSTGLIYVPSSFASTEEITEIAKVVASHGGIYVSHIRGEGTNLLKSVAEALKIGQEADLPVHISHFKSSGRDAWGLVREAIRVIEDRQVQGQMITADQYPYIATSTSLGATVLPSWAREGSDEDLRKRLVTKADQMRDLIAKAIEKTDGGTAIRIATYAPMPAWVGMDLAAIAELTKRPIVDVVIEILRHGDASIVKFSISEEDVRYVMQHDWVATASDGGVKLPGATKPHPRNYGTFPRKIAYYSLKEGVIPIEQAVRSMTGLPAEILSMHDRGLLRDGLVADITVFDPAKIRDTATFDQPHQYAKGIRFVFVNGEAALVEGHPTGNLAGRSLRYAGHADESKP